MDIMEFCNKVKKDLEKYAGEEAAVSLKSVMKNNGIELHSVIVNRKGTNLSPNIYLDDLHIAYEKGEDFNWVMNKVIRIYEESSCRENIDMSFFLEYESMQEQVVYKIINREKNGELLKSIPWIPFLDMAIVFYCHVPRKELGNATIMIYNNHLDMWGITKARLYDDAVRNTARIMPARILSIEKMVEDIISNQEEEDPGQQAFLEELDEAGRMFVLGNTMKLFGAAAVLYEGLLESIREKLGKNLFVLPSSVHEVILIPDDEQQEAEELWRMVCDINATQVEPEEVLTDSVYYFSGKCRKLEKIC